MKKFVNPFLLFLLCCTSLNAFAQNHFPATGNVGVGTTAPVNKLTIDNGATRDGLTMLSDGSNVVYSDINFRVKNLSAFPAGNVHNWVISHRKDGYFSGGPTLSSLEFYGSRPGGGYVAPLIFEANGDVILASPYAVSRSGNVGIGLLNPQYKLTVAGTVGARKMKVTQETWADFVFRPEYQLPSLQELDAYIKVHKRLPDMPSESEVLADGLDIGEMNRKLLQKVEELTLYVIEQDKRIKVLESRSVAGKDR